MSMTYHADEIAPPPPVRYCSCGNAIGDGDWASGHRFCALHRRRTERWTHLPSPRR